MPRCYLAHLVLLAAVANGAACSRDRESARPHERAADERAPARPGSVAPPGALTPASRNDEPRPVQPRDALATVDSDMRQVLVTLQQLGARSVAGLTPEQARKQPPPAEAVRTVLTQKGRSIEPTPMAKIEKRYIPSGPSELELRIYTPKTGDEPPLPVVLYFRGGGFVIANLDAYDPSARALADEADAIVVSADYRMAPEHKFPAAHDDAFAAYQWVLKSAASFGGDPKRIAVAGESAGGNLAANVALMARDRGVAPPLHVLLVYPITQTDLTTVSYQEWGSARPLDKAAMSWFLQHYVHTPADLSDVRLNPVNANLKGFPRTTIVLAEVDPLRTDGEMLARRLEAAGVDVKRKTYHGVTHEFFGMGALVGDAKDAEEYAGDRLEEAFEL